MLFSPPSVYAAGKKWIGVTDGVPTFKSLETLFENAVGAAGWILMLVFFVMIIVAGYSFLFSGGDQKKIQQAQGTLTAAVAGVVILSVAVLILRTIDVFTGAAGTSSSVLKFTIP